MTFDSQGQLAYRASVAYLMMVLKIRLLLAYPSPSMVDFFSLLAVVPGLSRDHFGVIGIFVCCCCWSFLISILLP